MTSYSDFTGFKVCLCERGGGGRLPTFKHYKSLKTQLHQLLFKKVWLAQFLLMLSETTDYLQIYLEVIYEIAVNERRHHSPPKEMWSV